MAISNGEPALQQNQYSGRGSIPSENFPRRLFAWPEEYEGEAWMGRSTRHTRQTFRGWCSLRP